MKGTSLCLQILKLSRKGFRDFESRTQLSHIKRQKTDICSFQKAHSTVKFFLKKSGKFDRQVSSRQAKICENARGNQVVHVYVIQISDRYHLQSVLIQMEDVVMRRRGNDR